LTPEEIAMKTTPAGREAAVVASTALAEAKGSPPPGGGLTGPTSEIGAASEVPVPPAKDETDSERAGAMSSVVPATVVSSETMESQAGRMGCLRDGLLVGLGSLFGAILALGLLFYVNGTIDFGQHERVKLLDSTIATLEQQNDDLKGQLQQHSAGLDEVKANAAADAQRIAALKAQSDAAQTATHELETRLAQAEAKTAALDASMGEVVQGNADLRSQLDEATTQIAGLQDGAARMEQAARDLQTQVSGALSGRPATPPGVTIPGFSQIGKQTIANTPALEAFPPATPIPAPRSGQGHLYGVVWADRNGNGIPDAGEEAISDVRIVLRSSTATELASTVTGADGRYLFADIDPNPYGLVAFIPSPLSSAQARTVSVIVGSDEAVEVNLNSLAP
jgi:hypothetical protein